VRKMTAEKESVGKEKFDISSLKEMRSVKRDLQELASFVREEIEPSEIEEILETRKQEYAATRRFQEKAEELERIINLLDEGKISADDILRETEVSIEAQARGGKAGGLREFWHKLIRKQF